MIFRLVWGPPKLTGSMQFISDGCTVIGPGKQRRFEKYSRRRIKQYPIKRWYGLQISSLFIGVTKLGALKIKEPSE